MTDTVPEERRGAGSVGDSSEEDPRRSPANVAVPLVYMASEQSDWLTGQIVGASGYELQLFNKPAVIRQVRGTERWTPEGAAAADRGTVQAGRHRRRRLLRLISSLPPLRGGGDATK